MFNNSSVTHSFKRGVVMPSGLFSDMKVWLENKELKSVQHQEFVYSYYWYITYLWRYAIYAEKRVKQGDIKAVLKYNPFEKRVDYIVKQNGLLDSHGYTMPKKDYPVSWDLNGKGDIAFTMYSDLNENHKNLFNHFESSNFIIKSPISILNENHITESAYMVEEDIFVRCMQNESLQCAGFFLYGILKVLEIEKGILATISNKELCRLTGWSESKASDIKNSLIKEGLIHNILPERTSAGEHFIYSFLLKNNIVNVTEHSFEGLKGVGDGLLRFDFAVFDMNSNLKLLIEFDGKQHYSPIDFTGVNREEAIDNFAKTKAHDRYKHQYCEDNNIPLLRIPYWEYDNGRIESILSIELKRCGLLKEESVSLIDLLEIKISKIS